MAYDYTEVTSGATGVVKKSKVGAFIKKMAAGLLVISTLGTIGNLVFHFFQKQEKQNDIKSGIARVYTGLPRKANFYTTAQDHLNSEMPKYLRKDSGLLVDEQKNEVTEGESDIQKNFQEILENQYGKKIPDPTTIQLKAMGINEVAQTKYAFVSVLEGEKEFLYRISYDSSVENERIVNGTAEVQKNERGICNIMSYRSIKDLSGGLVKLEENFMQALSTHAGQELKQEETYICVTANRKELEVGVSYISIQSDNLVEGAALQHVDLSSFGNGLQSAFTVLSKENHINSEKTEEITK